MDYHTILDPTVKHLKRARAAVVLSLAFSCALRWRSRAYTGLRRWTQHQNNRVRLLIIQSECESCQFHTECFITVITHVRRRITFTSERSLIYTEWNPVPRLHNTSQFSVWIQSHSICLSQRVVVAAVFCCFIEAYIAKDYIVNAFPSSSAFTAAHTTFSAQH